MRVLSHIEVIHVSGGNSNETTDMPKRNIYDALGIIIPVTIASLISNSYKHGAVDWMTLGILGSSVFATIAVTIAGIYYFEILPSEFFFPNKA